MMLISASSENADSGESESAETPAPKAAAVLRKLRRLGAHSEGNITTPFVGRVCGSGNDGIVPHSCGSRPGSDGSSRCAGAHQDKRTLGKRGVEQDGGQPQRQTITDLR